MQVFYMTYTCTVYVNIFKHEYSCKYFPEYVNTHIYASILYDIYMYTYLHEHTHTMAMALPVYICTHMYIYTYIIYNMYSNTYLHTHTNTILMLLYMHSNICKCYT